MFWSVLIAFSGSGQRISWDATVKGETNFAVLLPTYLLSWEGEPRHSCNDVKTTLTWEEEPVIVLMTRKQDWREKRRRHGITGQAVKNNGCNTCWHYSCIRLSAWEKVYTSHQDAPHLSVTYGSIGLKSHHKSISPDCFSYKMREESNLCCYFL